MYYCFILSDEELNIYIKFQLWWGFLCFHYHLWFLLNVNMTNGGWRCNINEITISQTISLKINHRFLVDLLSLMGYSKFTLNVDSDSMFHVLIITCGYSEMET